MKSRLHWLNSVCTAANLLWSTEFIFSDSWLFDMALPRENWEGAVSGSGRVGVLTHPFDATTKVGEETPHYVLRPIPSWSTDLRFSDFGLLGALAA